MSPFTVAAISELQALEGLVAYSEQVRLLDRHETPLRAHQFPEFAREILSSLHALIIGITCASASREAAACGYRRRSPRHRPQNLRRL